MKLWFSKEKDDTPSAAQAAPIRASVPPPPVPPAPPPAPEPQPVAVEPPPPPEATEPPPAAPLQQTTTQRELYRSLMDALYDAVLLVDEKGHVVDSNKRVEQTFGYTPGEMWDMSLQQLIKGFGPHVLVQLAEPLHERRPVIIDGRGIRKDGSLFTAEITVGRVKLGRSENILMAVRDIGKRLLAVQEKVREQLQSTAPSPAAQPKVVRIVRKPQNP